MQCFYLYSAMTANNYFQERFPKSKSEWYCKSSIFILKCFMRGRGKTLFIYCTYTKCMYTHINAHTHTQYTCVLQRQNHLQIKHLNMLQYKYSNTTKFNSFSGHCNFNLILCTCKCAGGKCIFKMQLFYFLLILLSKDIPCTDS